MVRRGIWPYVWQDPPAAGALDGYQGALVRAANGNGTRNPQGFDFAANYRAWAARFGRARVQPWTYLYPTSNGATAASALHGAAGAQPVYQCDLEDAVPAPTIRAFCDRLHALAPGCLVVFDSYPTRAQFIRVNGAAAAATWDQAVRSFDVFCPQVYFASQFDDGWEREFAGKPIWPAFSPANTASWDYFQANLDRYGVVNLWRYPMTDDWQGKLHFTEDDMTREEFIAALRDELSTTATVSRVELRELAKLGASDALGADVRATRAAVSGLTDDESKILNALAGSEGRLLQALAGLQLGDPAAVQTIVEEIRKQPAATVAAIKEAL